MHESGHESAEISVVVRSYVMIFTFLATSIRRIICVWSLLICTQAFQIDQDAYVLSITNTVATMIDCRLQHFIFSIIFFCYFAGAESTSCRSCMADVIGPYPEKNGMIIEHTTIVRATESDPALVVCRYQCFDQYYNFDLRIDILDPKRLSHIRRTINDEHRDSKYNFTVIPNNVQTCNLSNNISETILKYWIHVGSPDIPTLIPKCFVQYSPNGLTTSTRCSSISTLAIIPGYSIPDPDSSTGTSSSTIITPAKTVSSSRTMCSTVGHYLTETVTVTVNVTVTPQSIPTANLEGNCTTLVHKIVWPVSVLITVVFLFFIIMMACLLCAKSGKCTRTQCKKRVGPISNHQHAILNSVMLGEQTYN